MATFLDHLGQPMVAAKQILTEEVARPGMTGVRQAWSAESAVAGLTPDRLTSIMRRADQGDMDAFLTLAEEMEERDPHYASVLQTRKLAVMGLERKLTWSGAAADHPKADEILEACQGLVAEPCFEDLLHHQLDAIAKGYAATEIVWRTDERWTPCRYEWRDPRWFQFDRETGRELRLRDPSSVDGLPLSPFKFALHQAARKSGLAARGGLARVVAFSFVCKLYGVKDWMAFAEIFGIPLRLGRYDGSASPADVDVLKQAVFGLGSDAAAVIPKSMDIVFPELGKATGGAELFAALVGFLDSQVSKAVLGQSGTTDMQSGGGYAQARVLDEVRGDLTKADARGLGATCTRDVLTPFVRFNWGHDAPVPAFELVVDEPEDMEALSTALERLVPLGLRVDQAEIRKKLKLSEPDDKAELLSAPRQTATPPAGGGLQPVEGPQANDDPEQDQALARERGQPSLARESGLAAARARRERIDGDLDDLVLDGMQDWERTFGPEAAAVVAVIRGAASFEAARLALDDLAKDLAAPAAARSLARAMFLAAATGEEASRRAE